MAGSFFAVANILAGVFHYLFQVIASKQMVAADFALFSVWLAKVAVLSMLGGLLQYAGNFFPSSRAQAEKSVLISTLLTLAFSVLWFWTPDSGFVQGLLIVIASGLFGWILGQIQQRLMFLLMGIMNLAMALAKVIFVLIPGTFSIPIDRFSYALLISYFISLFIVAILTRIPRFEIKGSLEGADGAARWSLWIAPLVLSIAGATIPQMDIIILQRWITAETFQDFVRASLFYKGIYFLMFIFAQWMLPQQIAKVGSKAQKGILTYHFAIAALLGSLAVTLIAPLVERLILKWDSMPPSDYIFWSCLSISLLTWIFLLIQESCARRDIRWAVGTLFVIFGNLFLQSLLKLEIVNYFQLSIFIYSALILVVIRHLRASEDKLASSR